MKNIKVLNRYRTVSLVLFVLWFCLPLKFQSQTEIDFLQPTLGNYPNSAVRLNGNLSIVPTAIPTDTLRMTGTTSTSFKGIITVNPSNGQIHVTNAHPVGNYLISVRAYGTSGINSTTFLLSVQPGLFCSAVGSSSFFTRDSEVVTRGPVSLAVGDFNKDGNQDFTVASQFSNRTTIVLNDGTGSLSQPANSPYGSNVPYFVAVGDFNGDGNQDFASADSGDPGIRIKLGDGQGNFFLSKFASDRNAPYAITTGDFNGDGHLDLATVNTFSNNVSVFLNDGAGNFTVSANSPFAVGVNPRSLKTGDFNHDGVQDLAVVNAGSLSVSILTGSGAGNFTLSGAYQAGSGPITIAVGDLNNDGYEDILTAGGIGNGNIGILLGNNSGTFNSLSSTVPGNPTAIATADFNGDNKEDLAASSLTGSVYIKSGNGDGTFSPAFNYGFLGVMPYSIAIGDYNNDGRPEFAVVNYGSDSVSLILSRCSIATAASAVVSGRIISSNGNGISNVRLSLSGGDNVYRYTISNSFGYFYFDGVPVGATYILTASSKKHQINSPSRILNLLQDENEILFLVE